ncbi:YjfZ/YjiC family protein [Escherichia coli]|uniref:YjfZ/YjiC family protein n=1 Tax=Escherichia coli TaxID=562 RepID=UPI0021BF9CC6|nr:YjfZ/YjiC family protein [Escherichia coli]
MSMPLSNTLQSQIITDNHFLHHPKVDSELTRKYERARLDTENIYLLPLARGNNHNYDGKSVVEIRKLDISKESWPFNYVTEACRESDGITTTGRMLYRNLKITSALDEKYGGICKKAHAATELAEGLRLNLFMKSPFDPVENYTVHEITLGPGCNVPGYAGTTIGYISTLPVSQAKRWTNEQPRIDIYIDQIITVSGVANSSGFALAALLNANIEMGNDPIIGIEAYPGTAEIHAKMGYKVIPGDEDAPLKRMTLQPSSLPELFELKNGEWNYIGK